MRPPPSPASPTRCRVVPLDVCVLPVDPNVICLVVQVESVSQVTILFPIITIDMIFRFKR